MPSVATGLMERELATWFAAQLPEAEDVRVEGLDRVHVGHSAETLMVQLRWRANGAEEQADVVLRLRPPPPGLLEPYDLPRQFHILRALETTAVRSPRSLWLEPSGDVLGREFYVMERLDGAVYEQVNPELVDLEPARVRRMSEGIVEQLAAIHAVDLSATGLDAMGDGRSYVDRELEHWTSEIRRVQKGPVPALDRLIAELRARQPEQYATVTLVHGDPKPGNFAFRQEEVVAVYDWEMADVGDPLADLGYAELMWTMPGELTKLPGALTVHEFVERYRDLTGIIPQHRAWYRAFQCFKVTAILLVGSMLFDSGHSDDLRLAMMGTGVPWLTQHALSELGVGEALDHGPVGAREERVAAVRERLSHSTPRSAARSRNRHR
jgi:aminoglycoside phosphotransferase (APT) family kinase protein